MNNLFADGNVFVLDNIQEHVIEKTTFRVNEDLLTSLVQHNCLLKSARYCCFLLLLQDFLIVIHELLDYRRVKSLDQQVNTSCFCDFFESCEALAYDFRKNVGLTLDQVKHIL